MTDVEIEAEFMADKYRTVLNEGREPDLDEFETTEIDTAMDDWAKEDEDFLNALATKDDPAEWEEVDLNG